MITGWQNVRRSLVDSLHRVSPSMSTSAAAFLPAFEDPLRLSASAPAPAPPRPVSTSTNQMYKLPSDMHEMDRLNLQHRMWKLFIRGRGLYPPEIASTVETRLRQNTASKPAVLDVGSGTGIWVSDMASLFPDAQVVGFDLVKPNTSINFAQNCRFLTGDLTKGFTDGGLPAHFRGAFDVVHTRTVICHLKDAIGAMNIIAQCLKPGGVFIMPDGNFTAWDQQRHEVPPARIGASERENAGRSWLALWLQQVHVGVGPHLDYPMARRVAWMRECGLFGVVGHRDCYGPFGWTGEGVPDGEELGQMMTINVLEASEGFKSLMLSAGLSKEEVDECADQLKREAESGASRYYINWPLAWGVRKA